MIVAVDCFPSFKIGCSSAKYFPSFSTITDTTATKKYAPKVSSQRDLQMVSPKKLNFVARYDALQKCVNA